MMKNAPSLHSMGQLVKQGFIFVWIPSYQPGLINTTTGEITPLDVSANLPYLKKNGVRTYVTDQRLVQLVTGIKISKDQVMTKLEGI